MQSHCVSARQFDLMIRISTFFLELDVISIDIEYLSLYNYYSMQSVIFLAIFYVFCTIIQKLIYGRKSQRTINTNFWGHNFLRYFIVADVSSSLLAVTQLWIIFDSLGAFPGDFVGLAVYLLYCRVVWQTNSILKIFTVRKDIEYIICKRNCRSFVIFSNSVWNCTKNQLGNLPSDFCHTIHLVAFISI